MLHMMPVIRTQKRKKASSRRGSISRRRVRLEDYADTICPVANCRHLFKSSGGALRHMQHAHPGASSADLYEEVEEIYAQTQSGETTWNSSHFIDNTVNPEQVDVEHFEADNEDVLMQG